MLTENNSIKIKEILSGQKSVVALGNFDGVHIAHRFLICEAVRLANENSLKSVVYTFDSHPKTVLGYDVEYISDNSEKAELIENTGADVLYFQKTDTDFLKLSPRDFAQKVLKDTLNISVAVVGEHYTFGANGEGDASVLSSLGKELGFEVKVLPLIEKDGYIVSSTAVRELLSGGKIKVANALLGRAFSVSGRVEGGNRIGRTLGFPTINVYPDEKRALPAFGVYAATVVMDGREYKAVLNIGVKPTVGSERVVIEAHLPEITGDFYEKDVKICFNEFIRPEKKFKNLDELKAQIEKDKEFVKKFEKNSL